MFLTEYSSSPSRFGIVLVMKHAPAGTSRRRSGVTNTIWPTRNLRVAIGSRRNRSRASQLTTREFNPCGRHVERTAACSGEPVTYDEARRIASNIAKLPKLLIRHE